MLYPYFFEFGVSVRFLCHGRSVTVLFLLDKAMLFQRRFRRKKQNWSCSISQEFPYARSYTYTYTCWIRTEVRRRNNKTSALSLLSRRCISKHQSSLDLFPRRSTSFRSIGLDRQSARREGRGSNPQGRKPRRRESERTRSE